MNVLGKAAALPANFRAIFMAAIILLVGAAGAQAQNYDRLVEIGDDNVEGVDYDPSPAGGSIEYLFEVINNGPGTAPGNTVLQIEVPANATLQSTRGDLTCAPVNPSLWECPLPDIADGGSVSVIGTFDVPQQGVVTVVARVPDVPAGGFSDTEPDNSDPTGFDIEERTTIEAGADLGLALDLPDTARSGEVIDFTYTLSNDGPDPSTSSTFEVPIPAGLTNLVAPAGCTISGSVATCTNGALAVGASTGFTFSGQVDVASGSTVVATGAITDATPGDAVASNNVVDDALLVEPGTDLTVQVTADESGPVQTGTPVVFTVEPSYTGEEPTDISFTFDVPSEYQVLTAPTPVGWSCSLAGAVGAQSVTCTRPDGGGAGTGADIDLGSIDIETTAIAEGPGNASVTISSAAPTESNPSNNTDTVAVEVEASELDLDVFKTRQNPNPGAPNPSLAVVGDEVSYRLGAVNTGNLDFEGTALLIDRFPAGLTLTRIEPQAGLVCRETATGPAIAIDGSGNLATPLAGGDEIVCTIDYAAGAPLEAGQAIPSLLATFEITQEGSFANGAEIEIDPLDDTVVDADQGNDVVTTGNLVVTTDTDTADVRPIKTDASPGAVAVGEIQTFRIEIVNEGPADVTLQSSGQPGVLLQDDFDDLLNGRAALPGDDPEAGLAGIRLSDPSGVAGVRTDGVFGNGCLWDSGNRLLTCRLDTLEVCVPGSTCPFYEIDVRPGLDDIDRPNVARVTSLSVPDDDRSNDTDSTTFTVEERADITVAKSVTPSTGRAGQDVVYAIDVLNRPGFSTAEDVELVDVLPAGLRIIEIEEPAGVTCSQPFAIGDITSGSDADRTLTCDIGNLSQNQQRTVRVTAKPTLDTLGTTLTNTADVTTVTPEDDLTNNDASADVTISPPVLDLLVNKEDDADPVTVGSQVTYTITVENGAGSDSENVTAIDYLPPTNLDFVNVSSPDADGVCVGPLAPDASSPFPTRERVTCSWPLLPARSSTTPGSNQRTMLVTFDAVAKGTVRNEVAITSDEIAQSNYVGGVSETFDTREANNETSENTTIRTRTDLAATSKIARADEAGFPEVTEVSPEQDFFFDLTFVVRNGPGLAEADDVVLTDLLPEGVSLRGPIPAATVTGGTIAEQTCTTTDVGGRENVQCVFGTVTPTPITGATGSEVSVTLRLPVEIASGTDGASFDNEFSVTTSSQDIVTTDNVASDSVELVASSIAGIVFRDFDDSGTQDADDSEVTGVEIVLTGTTLDGQDVELRQTVTSGGYLFDNLAPGTYTVTRGPVAEDALDEGQALVGSGDGTIDGSTVLQTITIPADTDLVDYDFTLIPQSRIGLAKQVVGTPTVAADGSVVTDFALVVSNPALEPLTITSLTDGLSGDAPSFGTLGTAGSLAPGEYAVTGAPGGSCGNAAQRNADFDGAGDTLLASGFGLDVGAECTITFQVTVQPTVPLPTPQADGEIYRNQATVDATGDLSGQTSADNPNLTDQSDDGATANPAGDPSDADTPTPVAVTFPDPTIALVKTVDTSAVSTPPAVGDELTYTFAVTNTGPTTLTDVTVTDISLPGLVLTGDPIPTLAPDETDDTTYSATYALTQDDLDRTFVENTADVTGDDPYGGTATDTSGETPTSDAPTIAPLVEEPGITLIKTADTTALSDPPVEGEIVTYTFTVRNTGNVTLSNVTVTDPKIDVIGDPITLTVEAPGNVDSTTFSGTYALQQVDIDAGFTDNTATVVGTTQGGGTVTDISGTEQDNDTPTTVPLTIAPGIELVKVLDDSGLSIPPVPGETLTYTFEITNTGNVTLTDVTLEDPLPGLVLTGDPIPALAPGVTDLLTYSASYDIDQDDIDGQELPNTATVTGTFDDGIGGTGTVSDDDTAVADLQAIEANPEPYPPFETDGGTTTTVLASDLLNGETPTLDTVTITVVDSDPEVTLDPATGLITLAPGNPAGSYEVTYQIESIEFPGLVAETTETVVQLPRPAIETTKTQELVDLDGSGGPSLGDRVDYTIAVQNTGNVALDGVTLEDTLSNRLGQPLDLTAGPTFVSADAGSAEGALEVDETATYTASRTLDEEAFTGRGLSNEAVATATDRPIPGVTVDTTEVTDQSDDGIDTDGNTVDDPTVTVLSPDALLDNGLRLSKTTNRDIVRRGEVVPYTLTISNQRTVDAGPVDLRDRLPDGFVYVDGTASVDGEAVDVDVSDNNHVVIFRDITVPGDGIAVATLSARVLNVVDVGEHTNVAQVLDPVTGDALTSRATATVRLLPEPAFDCGEVIGKVFNDLDGDGHQDGSDARDNPGISNQDFGGKGGKVDFTTVPRTEVGIPAVRLVTVDGLVVTTDQYGRFSVPCAALPQDRGSNFLLKLDERTLPTGWRATSENPRVARLTPGMMTEMNFGATLGRVVRVDVNATAFSGRTPIPALVQGMRTMVAQLDRQPTVVRFAYHVPASAGSAEVREARAQIRRAERELGRMWRADGRGPLRVETVIVRPAQ